MIEKKTLASVMGGVLVGGMLLTGGMAFASDNTNTTVKDFAYRMPFFGHGMDNKGGMPGFRGQKGGAQLNQKNLALLVEKGVITQDKATAIQNYMDKAQAEKQTAKDVKSSIQQKPVRTDLLTGLVSNNILTQAEVDTIKTKLQELSEEQKQAKIEKALQSLIDKGTITQAQADKITSAFATAESERASMMTKIENMTVKEAREYFQSNSAKPQDALSQLVEDSVITQDQADAYQVALREVEQSERTQEQADGIAALVTKGTITQEQADKVTAALADAQKEREALAQKLQQMTDSERQQYMEENKDQVKTQDPISQLVTDGVITDAQATALKAIVGFGGPNGFGGHEGPRGGFGHGGRH